MSNKYRAGDVIKHIPTDEEWLVATVDQTHIGCAGWPYTLAPFKDCILIEAASDEYHLSFLKQLASISVPDPRRSYASDILAALGVPVSLMHPSDPT